MDFTIENDFEQKLIDKGYNFFKDSWKGSIKGIQKRFKDKLGTKYFITGYHYNFKKQFPEKNMSDLDKYTFDTQFRLDRAGKDQTIDISYAADFLENEYRPTTSIEEMEEFFEKMFITTKADYYEYE